MVLVLILVAIGVVLGMSYLSTASLRLDVSRNYTALARARYLAESGVEHALYVVRFTPEQLAGQSLGTFYVDGSPDGYTITAAQDPDVPGRYTLSATAAVGGVRRTSSAVIQRQACPTVDVDHGLLVRAGLAWTPWNLTITGNVHVNGTLINWALVEGDASATSGVIDAAHRISGAIDGDADEVESPTLTVAQYRTYQLGGQTYQAVEYTGTTLDSNNPLNNGGAVTPGNPGGVVYLNPSSGNTVTINNDVSFTGTLLINGHVRLNGRNINLTAVNGFPTIVATGLIRITNNARNVALNGLVSADAGFLAFLDGATPDSSVTVTGGVLSKFVGYWPGLLGNHRLVCDPERAQVYDFSLPPEQRTPLVRVVRWMD
jgi:hypothetical protein